MYSRITNFTFGVNKCGNYSAEGDCYNRVHSVPQSWFKEASPMKSDAWHVVPTDSKINGIRSNFPFGEVGVIKESSEDGFSKLGSSITPGYSGTVFEPNDLYKGDFARMYLYMATCYHSRVNSWEGGVFPGTYPHLKRWVVDMMSKWHWNDPVSQKEIIRNEAIYNSRQQNRNPFIDYPKLVELIFGNRQNETFQPDKTTPEEPDFEILSPTNITSESFTVNWRAK